MATFFGGIGNESFYGTILADTAFGGGGTDKLYGFGSDDTLSGDAGNDFLFGSDGNDVLLGGTGVDNLYGGAHDDVFFGGTGNDSLFGGSGSDTADYSDATGAVTVDLSGVSDFASGDASVGRDALFGIEAVVGTDYADTLRGDNADNVFTSGAGADVIRGGGGNDAVTDFDRIEDTLDVVAPASVTLEASGADMLVIDGSNTITLQGAGAESPDPADWHLV